MQLFKSNFFIIIGMHLVPPALINRKKKKKKSRSNCDSCFCIYPYSGLITSTEQSSNIIESSHKLVLISYLIHELQKRNMSISQYVSNNDMIYIYILVLSLFVKQIPQAFYL